MEYDEKKEVTERLQNLRRLLREASDVAGNTAAGFIKEPSALYDFLSGLVYDCNWAAERIPDRYKAYYGEELPDGLYE